ncbi:PREDICTED: receptor-like protein 12 isoform X2 [Camelina sativa]|uniref:Receptor-like protein 12 isoform X2 n=1 Tax=Camelina sativa TaxID=90675 RepID=A0ABM0XN20_CAMSA|nr:PREDICTED: receptor-like protein 12 isoform X2 [Camelina sativa]
MCDAILGEVISLKLCSSLISVNTSLKSSSGLFKLHHLTFLDLSQCRLHGKIPSSIGNLSHLTSLDLSQNQLVGEVPDSIGNLNNLDYVNLGENYLRGNILTLFGNFTELYELNLRENQFTGGISVLANLTFLSEIDISLNHFKSSFPSYDRHFHLCKFSGYGNSFSGPFPTSLFMQPFLDEIDLSGNQFEGSIDFENTSSSTMLRVLHFGYNNLDGLIPESISKLVNLEGLVLSHNNFRGEIPRSISKLGNLFSLDLSHNNLGGQVPKSISKLGNLFSLDLSHNNFGGRVPRSMSKLVNLTLIDLSHNKLEGQVPQFFWRFLAFRSIKLSHNSFTSFENPVEVINGASMEELDFGSNSLQGLIPQWICNFTDLYLLDLSNNHFTGSIPQCLKNFHLSGLNLRNNSLSGFLPELCMDSVNLRSLDVSYNNLVGKLPKSLIHCELMEFLNVQENKIKDTFPFWLGSLQYLTVLVLRSNAFYGPVYNSSAYLGFPSMRIIDISDNNFVGSLPQDYFANWTEMSKVFESNEDIPEMNYMSFNASTMYDSIDLVYKGVDTDFVRIFKALRVIDFSGNQFCGYIPRPIGLLSELRLLNLSGNGFTGNIPPTLENITKLETLDLSRNNLSGEIPQGLGKLSFLSVINFSYNHLEGLVPQSTQFGSQNCSSFVGNSGLYGLENICGVSHQTDDESSSEPEEPVLNWIAAMIAVGPGVFCGLVIGHIFTSYKHEWFIAR